MTIHSLRIKGDLFSMFLVALVLEGILLGIIWWTVAAAAIASVLYLVCKSIDAHHCQRELVDGIAQLRKQDGDEHHNETCLSPHLRRELQQMMSRVRPDDLSVVETAALLAILVPAHRRVVGGPASRPLLRAAGVRSEHAASNLAQ